MEEWKLDINEFIPKFVEICGLYELNPNNVRFYSQQDEDKYIIQKMLKEKITDGTFLELGACDGIICSNTKTLEDYFGFSGVLIEPIKHYFDMLVVNRPNCKKYNLAVSDSEEEEVNFCGLNGEAGIINYLSSKNIYNTTYKVKNKPLSEVIKMSGFDYIDLMVVDVEGAELQVLKSIDFDFPIYTIFVEAHSNQVEKNKKFGEFLTSKGFVKKERQRGNEVWYNPNYFRKNLFQEW